MEPVVVHHLLFCLEASYDLDDPVTPYSLHNLAFVLPAPTGTGYPGVAAELWVFARVEGEGDCDLWVEVFRTDAAEDGEVELVAAYGPFRIPFGADLTAVSRAWKLLGVPFPAPGWYEFRLTQVGEVLATEFIYLLEE
jgi:hypothetical protein